ncbi:MAG: hypothetical protein EDM05_58510 [Leptolyngbya sp. IPPAS B-1204]|nr:MAG: hypothetical protein EDM05_32765 [Leptolyngbya sp. IPPAS B-1204]
MVMSPKEELIQAIEQSPDELVQALLELLRVMQRQQSSVEATAPTAEAAIPLQEETEPKVTTAMPSRLHRKQGILVIETGNLDEFDINTFIDDVREERIQNQGGQFKL